MPKAPPIHRPKGYKPKQPWQRAARGQGKTTTERGYGWRWQQQRKRIIERDFGLCQPCKAKGVVTAFDEVDHIINLASGGDDSDKNLQCICAHCHKEKTQRERTGTN
ncbi:HNH endonuclease [Methylophaga lonarensis]|uniref:HNH endonuclease n=1 Tax=Methylophaga lonarensis TaxID=999151 RepID=UPI003D28D9A4